MKLGIRRLVVVLVSALGAPAGAPLAQLTTTTNTFTYPYANFGTPVAVKRGAADVGASVNPTNGAIGLYTSGYIGGASAKGYQYVSITVSNPSRITVEVEMTLVEAIATVGPAALAGTDFLWRTDAGLKGDQTLTPPFTVAQAIPIIADIALMVIPGGGALDGIAKAAEIAEVASAVSLHAALATQPASLTSSRTFSYTFDAGSGSYFVGAGLQATAAGAATGAAWAVLLAQVDLIRVIVKEQPYEVEVDVQGLTNTDPTYDTFSDPDPYIEVHVRDPGNNHIGTTSVKTDDATPTWSNEIQTGTVSERLFELVMKAYDEDNGWWGDQLMGTSTVRYDASTILNWTDDSVFGAPNFVHRLRATPTIQNPPVAITMPDRTAAKGQLIPFDGPGSTDLDDGIQDYRWEFRGNGWGGSTGAGWFTWNNIGNYSRTVPSLTGEYVARLTVRDFSGLTSRDDVLITVEGDPPAARASANNPAGVGRPVNFTGIGSTDPDNDIAEFRWTFGPGWTGVTNTGWINWSVLTVPDNNVVGNIVVTNEGNYTRTAPATPGMYSATLMLRDYQGLEDTRTIQVAVIPTTLVVNSLSDVDDGLITADPAHTNSLRKCIRLANTVIGPNTITFSVSGTIQPSILLPTLTDDDTVIDASSQWVGAWPNGAPGVTVDGQGPLVDGIQIIGADRCSLRGLQVKGFNTAVRIDAASHTNVIGGLAAGERNVLENFLCWGDDNLVVGNYVGLDPPGTNGPGGYFSLNSQAERNWIGGNTTHARNLVKGSIQIDGDHNVVSGNYVGLDQTGTTWLGGSILILGDGNRVGGTAQGDGNVVGASSGVGIWLNGSSSNMVYGNLVALDATGRQKLSNPTAGIRIDNGGQYNKIGGEVRGSGNVVAAGLDGILIQQAGTHNNTVQGNLVGVDRTGTNVTGMTGYGIYLLSGPQTNLVGGTVGTAANVIGGCARGVVLWQVTRNTVSGNFIGTDLSRTVNLGNTLAGVWNESGDSNVIGTGNVIANNGSFGVVIKGGRFNHITQNEIFGNGVLGIDLQVGGNAEIPAPVFGLSAIKLNLLTISGSGAPAGGTVEIFATAPFTSQGHTYLGSVPTGPSGSFGAVMNFPTATFTHVTATGVDINLDTSAFSPAPFQVAPLANHGLGNGNFGSGLAGWVGWSEDEFGGPASGSTGSSVLPSTLPGTDDRVEISRVGAAGEPGAHGIEQILDLRVTGWTSVRIKFDVEVETQTLPGGGAEGEEYPASVRLEYTDDGGNRRYYRHGFYSMPGPADPELSTLVPPSAWVPFVSENLLELPDPPPAHLEVLRLFGSGQDYLSRFANVELLLQGPLLDIHPADPDVTVSWPLAADDYDLQRTEALATASWSVVVNAPNTNGQELHVTRPATNDVELFRLTQP